MKERLPFDDSTDVRSNLPDFIRFMSTRPFSPRFTWPEFARVWAGRTTAIQTSYETLRADTAKQLVRIVLALTGKTMSNSSANIIAEQHSFSRAKASAEKNASKNTEMSFVREGVVGGWRRHFTPEAEAALHEGGYAEAMRGLGYEFEHHGAGAS